MYLMKTLGVIKPWNSLIWHKFVKIDVFEKLANFEATFEGEGVEIRENWRIVTGMGKIWTFRISNQIFHIWYGSPTN